MALVIHGVGDHSRGDILRKAEAGLAAMHANDIHTETVKLEGLSELGDRSESSIALRILAGGQAHFVLPIIWSRLRPRAAKEAEHFMHRDRAHERLFDAMFLLLPASIDAIRSILAASGLLRRSLVSLAALLYAVLAPGIALAGFGFVVYLITLRATADKLHYEWWRAPALIVGLALLSPIVRRILMVCDFVGDVVSYVGNAKHRKHAEEQLLRIIREVAGRYPAAQILVVGHSLGSVLVTQSVLQLADDEDLSRRLHIATMGSPLLMMSWCFPTRVLGPEQLLKQFERRELVSSWANVWRDADWIGRSLKAPMTTRFAETSLGDGAHADYWADPRCWWAIVRYLRATAEESLERLASEWTSDLMSEDEERELIRRAKLAIYASGLNILIVAFPFYFWKWLSEHSWLAVLDFWNRWAILTLVGIITVLTVIYYYFTSKRVGGDGSTQRQMLARYRLNWSIAMACVKPAAALAIVSGFVVWRSLAP